MSRETRICPPGGLSGLSGVTGGRTTGADPAAPPRGYARPINGAEPPSAGPRSVWRRLCECVVEPVMSVLFPPRCVGCGDFEHHLCPHCEASLTAIGDDCCPRCGEPGPRPLVGGRCSHCMGMEVAYAAARSAFAHVGAAKRLVVEFKSGGQPVLGGLMARSAVGAFAGLVAQAAGGAGTWPHADRVGPAAGATAAGDVVVSWVPTHAAAKRERGYNQAELLARALAAGHSPALPAVGLACKPVRTRHQKVLDRAGRRANLHGAFTLEERAVQALWPRPRAVVLVDDVYTTGATTQEVAHVLTARTGIPVYVFTFSRAVSARTEGHD